MAESRPRSLLRALLRSARRFGAWMNVHYLRMDPRTAGLYRIVLGLLCALDCLRHAFYARLFYSNDGVLTNHWHLFKPDGAHNFSLFHAFSTPAEVYVAFALAFACHVALMIGWRSRLMAVLSLLVVTSLDNRLVMVENGGYVVVNLAVAYACFLPIERRFSVDAFLRSWRERRETRAAELNVRYLPPWATEDYVSLAALLVVLNLAVIYLFNVVNKSGEVWRKGETVHYVLFLNRMVTGVAVLFRTILPMWMTRVITWSVIGWEAMLAPLILAPTGRRLTRTLAMFGIWGLHLMFGLMFRLGPFAWFLIGWSFTLMTRDQWDLLDGFLRRRARARTVIYDASSPVALVICRVLSRANGMSLLRFEESTDTSSARAQAPLLAARDDASGEVFLEGRAIAEIARALPGGRYVFPILGPFLRPAFTWASARREALARFFGLDASPSDMPASVAPDAAIGTPAPASLRVMLWRARLRETFLAYFALCAVWQAVLENKSIPEVIRNHLPMPSVISATINYPRLYQGWGMFAPNPITDDGTLVVDAHTIDGRRIDPFTGKAPELDLTISNGLGLGQIPQDYFNRIRLDRNTVYRQGLQDYLRAWHLRTGKPEDELVAFDVYWVRDQCPKPGDTKPYANEDVAIATWRKPGYKLPPGSSAPPIPPEPKVVSAEVPPPDKSQDVRRIFGIRLPNFMQ